MNEHTGWHEYKDGKRVNPERLACLSCLAHDRNIKEGQFLLALGKVSLWQGELALGNYEVVKIKGMPNGA